MPASHIIMGLFQSADQAAEAIGEIQARPWTIKAVHGPVPSPAIAAALGQKSSRVGWFTLAGGIVGFFTGFLLAAFTASQWHIIVSGKPVMALVPFFIVGFEFAILFAVFGNVVGLIHQMRLPAYGQLRLYDERCSGDMFGVAAACGAGDQDALTAFFRQRGAQVRAFQE
jgi:molybdopterin-containing oxidoreductase family membrane subunit